jgi:uncharacterized membrane protein
MKNYLRRSFELRFDKSIFLKPAVLMLILSNLLFVIGAVSWGWNTFILLALYWSENLVIGLFTVFKMLLVPRQNAGSPSKIAAAVFFCFHYGMFTLVHGMFIFLVFSGDFFNEPSSSDSVSFWSKVMDYQLYWPVLALLISHGVSFFNNYLGNGEYRKSNLNNLMQQPYGRVVVLHITIIFSGFLLDFLNSPVIGMVLLIMIKTVIDIRAHLMQHERYNKPAPEEVVVK